jgi:hypothetical protein
MDFPEDAHMMAPGRSLCPLGVFFVSSSPKPKIPKLTLKEVQNVFTKELDCRDRSDFGFNYVYASGPSTTTGFRNYTLLGSHRKFRAYFPRLGYYKQGYEGHHTEHS